MATGTAMEDVEGILISIRTRTRTLTLLWTKRVPIRTIMTMATHTSTLTLTTMVTHMNIRTMILTGTPIINTIHTLMITRTCTESIYMS